MKKYIILMPLYNDWKSAAKLLNEIDLQTQTFNLSSSAVILSSENAGRLQMGKPPASTLTSPGIYLSGSGEFNFSNAFQTTSSKVI